MPPLGWSAPAHSTGERTEYRRVDRAGAGDRRAGGRAGPAPAGAHAVRARGAAAPRRGRDRLVGPDGGGGRPYPAPPFWASAWAGGQGLARYVLDHRERSPVAGARPGRRLGLVAIAAAMAGAAQVVANDVDPYAVAAVDAQRAGQPGRGRPATVDLLDGAARGRPAAGRRRVLQQAMADRVLAFLRRAGADGARGAGRRPGPGAPAGGRGWNWSPAIRCRPPNPPSTPRFGRCRCSSRGGRPPVRSTWRRAAGPSTRVRSGWPT